MVSDFCAFSTLQLCVKMSVQKATSASKPSAVNLKPFALQSCCSGLLSPLPGQLFTDAGLAVQT
jgi:hypothetical protein